LSRAALGALLLVCVLPTSAAALDAETVLTKGTWALGLQVGGGEQNNIQGHRTISGVAFVNLEPRLGYFPFEPFGKGWIKGTLEAGLEGWFQSYFEPDTATAGGLKVTLRYHALGLGTLASYVEGTAGAAGTNLKVMEIRSPFTFVLEGGVGLSYFVTSQTAINAGYRFQHLSNGHTFEPYHRGGVNSNSGVIGLTHYFK
jgi:opacity protein-like surface antigen